MSHRAIGGSSLKPRDGRVFVHHSELMSYFNQAFVLRYDFSGRRGVAPHSRQAAARAAREKIPLPFFPLIR